MSTKEIGSDFSFGFGTPTITMGACQPTWRLKDSLPADYYITLTDSGRSALRLALKQLRIGAESSVLVPSYLCHSVATALLQEGITPIYYSVDANLEPSLDDILMRKAEDTKMILIMDYFGRGSSLDEHVPALVSEGLSVVYDVSHSLFYRLQHPSDLVAAYVGSLRKLLPLPDGGIVFSKKTCEINSALEQSTTLKHTSLRTAAMLWKEAWLWNDDQPKPPFRELFVQAESLLDQSSKIGPISDVSKVLLNIIDFDFLALRRRANFLELLRLSNTWPHSVKPLFVSLGPDECPLGFPVIVDQRDDFRAFLINSRVYPPIHWHIDKCTFSEFRESIWLSDHILTLPCDHRYDAKDMQVISDLIIKWGDICGRS
ncbi:MAG: DegT/DnrJ/EryC1/StrS family aminotransferase [Bacillota bacterium]